MFCREKDISINIYYKIREYTNLNAFFSIWDDTGTPLVNSDMQTGIINSNEGVLFYYNYTTPNSDCYILIKSYLEGKIKTSSQVIKIGSPAITKAFYHTKNYEEGCNVAYSINEATTWTIIQSGNLTEIGHGFYFANTTGLPPPWFFKVFPFSRINNNTCT